jgi:hypothetical protein
MGRTRAGLEVWLAEQTVALPESLVSAARSLADQVDHDPDASPLWGRYLDCLKQLHEPVHEAQAFDAELRRVVEQVGLARADERWRHEQHLAALERGDEYPEAWQKVVPISCARGQHHWGERNRRCVYCDTETAEEPVP